MWKCSVRRGVLDGQVVHDRTRRVRRTDPERREQTPAKIRVRRQRRAAVPRSCEPREEIPVKILGERIEGRPTASELGRPPQVAVLRRSHDEPAKEVREKLSMTRARLVDPVSLGTVQKLALRELARLVVAAGRDQGVDLADVHPQALPFEPDPVARRDEQPRLGPEHSPQRPGRAPEAGEGARRGRPARSVLPPSRARASPASVPARRGVRPGDRPATASDPPPRPRFAGPRSASSATSGVRAYFRDEALTLPVTVA
jgi:hypothetical protein